VIFSDLDSVGIDSTRMERMNHTILSYGTFHIGKVFVMVRFGTVKFT
jgi:hypothetical protein